MTDIGMISGNDMFMVDERKAVPESGLTGRILVIEDEPAVLELIVEVLNDQGYATFGAADGVAGLAVMRRGRIDLLVCDIRLPGISGFDVARAARILQPGVRILFMTGFGNGAEGAAHEDAPDAQPVPATEIMSKPFSMADLATRAAAMIAAEEIR